MEYPLHSNCQQLSHIFESIDDCIAMLNTRQEIVYANPAFCRFNGKDTQELMGVSFLHDFKLEHFGFTRTNFDKWEGHDRITGNDVSSGSRWLEWTATRSYGSDGEVDSFLIVGRDITERKKKELGLAASEMGDPVEGAVFDITGQKKNDELLWMKQFIYERAAVGIYQINRNGKIHDVNNMAADMLGYSREEMGAMVIWEVDPEITVENWPGIWEMSTEDGTAVFERRHRRKDGKCIPVEIFSNHIDYEGQSYSIAFATDITERKRVEYNLRERENLHRQAQRIAQLGHWEKMYAVDNVTWSEEVYRIYEFDKEDPELRANLYQRAFEFIHPEDRLQINRATEEAIENGNDLEFVHRIILAGDRIKYLHVKANIEYQEDGTPLKTIGTVQDITEIKEVELEKEKIEARLLQSQKLEAIGTFAGGIAHDFNNILTAIIGFAQLSMGQLPEGSRVMMNLEEVLKAGIRGRELVASILAFSRQDEQVFEAVNLEVITKEVIQLLRASISSRIAIQLNITVDCSPIFGVSIQIHQILLNLCTNASQAIGAGKGRISITLREVEVRADELPGNENCHPGMYAELTVSDTGCGMDQLTLAQVFDPYFSTKPKGEGTGLGLSVIHGIVAKHQGYICSYSDPGKGSTFSIYLPCMGGDAKNDLPEKKKYIPVGSECIAIVDDETSITEMLSEMLGNLGYKVIIFNDPRLAAESICADTGIVDLVITDLTMPGMDGVELAGVIREIDRKIPIILQSGFSEVVSGERVRQAGISTVVRKPVLEIELARCIRATLDEKRGYGENTDLGR